ncbi:MAG: MotA/TolQ/ExbB proton channel family protein [Verrucomicrobiales bacterium]
MQLILRFALLFLLLTLASTIPGFAQEAVEEVAAPSSQKSLLDMYLTGGIFMHPLLICSIGTIAVAAYCFVGINPSKMMPKSQVDTLTHFMKQRDPGSAYDLCRGNPNSFTNTVSAALLKVNFERELANKVSMEQAAAETLTSEETRYMIWVNYLNIFATIAPMIGLLGTVTGMIQAFDSLAAGKSEPADLSKGIGEAMTTTAGGLIVGIPAMFFYFFFRNKLMVAINDIQKSVTFLIDVLSGELKLSEAIEDTQAPQ